MRKVQQQEILNIIETMGQAHQEIRQALEKKDFESAKQILIECQECAIELGNAIEQIEGEGFVTVSYLEKYCDTVYCLFEETDVDSNPVKVTKTLRKALLSVENSVKNDVKIRKEVVFLPYKASMWDSLESVYLAAAADEDCDAYCVPIPYYDRREDGSLGMMHYEGNEYPKNIEITDYRTYNLEERRPDVIYIHNPYDEWNHVTSVPEMYYAKNLCHYTDMLVYIPYFILGETNADDQSDVDGMKHFCFLPGVIYANKVIVQSENMRQIYITEYIKAAKECGLNGEHINKNYQEQKILGLGSPKVDKVLNISKEDLDIPEKWRKIIEKPDGTLKKIVFYNTTINGLLHNDERMLRKMEKVFEIFRENRDEIALLWRPHPLIENTLTSMRPQLWEEYLKIKSRYIEENWGIYDDTADMDRAVTISDAYYGDQSSVLQVYKKTGKTIVLQDCNALREYKKSLLVNTWVIVDTFIYFVIANGNGLFVCDMDKDEISFVGSFPNEDANQCELYSGSLVYDKYIIFLPNYAKGVGVYNIEKKVFVENMWINIPKGGCYTQRISENADDIYIFGTWSNPYIYKFMPDKDKGYYVLPNGIKDKGHTQERMDMYGMCRTKSHIYFPVFDRECIVTFDMENEKLNELQIPPNGYHYIAVVLLENVFYLLDDSGKLISYDYLSQKLNVLFDIEQYMKQIDGGIYNKLVCIEGYLYMIPDNCGGPIVRYDLTTGKIEITDEIIEKQFQILFPKGGRFPAETYQEKIISFFRETISLEIIDLHKLERKEIDLTDVDNRTVLYGFGGVVSEAWGSVLPLVIDMLKMPNTQPERHECLQGQSGRMIYRATGK